ncbi:MAG: lytic transglycosylase domain-containing protein [Treponema sp.]|nr:lytic transglycosylase domain-containing protein [Treponema sp.]
MDSYVRRLFEGTVSLCVLFLTACLLVYFFVPAAEEDASPVAFNSHSTTIYADADSFLADASWKNDEFEAFSSRDDKGLALYRAPKTRPAVEWFYTNVAGNREVALAILENADKNDIPVSLAFALAYIESKYKPGAVNKNKNYTIDRGLFQLNSASFPKLTEADFFDPNTSAKYGMQHLRFCMDVAGNEVTALAMYNAGTTRVKNNETPQHTLNYVGKIENYRGRLEGMFTAEVYDFFQTQGSGIELAMVAR